MFCGGAGGPPRLLPSSRVNNFKKPEPTIARVKNHARNWLDAIHGGDAAGSHFEYGANLTELAMLGRFRCARKNESTGTQQA